MADDPTTPGTGPSDDEDDIGWAAPGGVGRPPDPGTAPGAPDPGTAPTAAAPGSAPTAPPPAWTPPPPPAGAAGAPVVERRRRRTWLVVLIVAVSIVVLSAIAGTVLFFDRSYPIYDAADKFVERIDKGQYAAAHRLLCARDRDGSSPENLRGVFSFIARPSDDLEANPLTVDRFGNKAIVKFSVDRSGDDDGDNDTYELPMVEENGDWRPCIGGPLRS